MGTKYANLSAKEIVTYDKDRVMRTKILDFIDSKARIQFVPFVEYVKTLTVDDFENYAKHPFLIGKELYEGRLDSDGTNDHSTMSFKKTSLQNMLRPNEIKMEEADVAPPPPNKSTGITRALFMLVKRRGSPGLTNEIYVGRNAINDIVIADYAVSKTHCRIIVNRGRYSILDDNSTNGTFYNDYPLKVGVEYELPPDSDIAFGRLVFRFISPRQLYFLLT